MLESTEKVNCPICNKVVARIGLEAHTKDVHSRPTKEREPNQSAAEDYLDYLNDRY